MPDYREIWEAMAGRYRELTGQSPDDASDIGIRLKVLAAQLERLWQAVESLREEAFPETAAGSWLDRHAGQRGLARKAAGAALGVLRFSRAAAAGYDIAIPKGTVCQTEGPDPVAVATTEAAVLAAGEKAVDCPARAVAAGGGGNAAPGRITVLVTPPQGITGVVNPAAFAGGGDEEDDASLRGRLLQSYRHISNGTNRAYYLGEALKFPGVASAAVLAGRRGAGTLDVVVTGPGTDLNETLLEEIREKIQAQREIGVDVAVVAAQPVAVEVAVEAAPPAGGDYQALADQVPAVVRGCFDRLGVGEPLLVARLMKALVEMPGLYNCRVSSPLADPVPLADQVLRSGTITVTRMAVGP